MSFGASRGGSTDHTWARRSPTRAAHSRTASTASHCSAQTLVKLSSMNTGLALMHKCCWGKMSLCVPIVTVHGKLAYLTCGQQFACSIGMDHCRMHIRCGTACCIALWTVTHTAMCGSYWEQACWHCLVAVKKRQSLENCRAENCIRKHMLQVHHQGFTDCGALLHSSNMLWLAESATQLPNRRCSIQALQCM